MLSLRSPLALLVLLTVAVTASSEADARKQRCKSGDRRVVKGTAVYGGPGLGFDVTYVFPGSRCVNVLRSTDDGSFALVPIADGRVGWVAAGLVEADLSEEKGAEPVAVASPYDVIALRATSVRRHPRFDAFVVSTAAPKATLKVTGTSPDGLWLYVETKGAKGWVSRYQTGTELPKQDSAPTAGSGAWTLRAPSASSTPPPKASLAKDTKATKAASDDDESEGERGDGEPPAREGGTDDDVPALASGPLLGRGQEISFAISLGHWSQRYLSDAQGDAFYKYELGSTGPAGTLSYAYRGDFPLVGELRVGAGLYGFDLVPPGAAEPVYTPVFTADVTAQVGWRLHGDEIVDVEAGLGTGGALVFISDLLVDDTPVDAFTPGLYLDAVRPYVAARSRLAGGDLGLVSLEAAVPLGAYVMLYDPGTKYLDDYKDAPIVDVAKPPRPDAEAVDDGDVEPPVLHPAVGVEGRLRYALPLGDVVRLRASFGLGVRQAFITGPGVRVNGIYTEATNIDVVGSFDLGADFGF